MIRVAVCGAYGKMGREVLKAVLAAEDLELVGAADPNAPAGADVGLLAGEGPIGLPVDRELAVMLRERKPEVVVEFTSPAVVMNNLRVLLQNKVCPVVGTTGLSKEDLAELTALSQEKNSPVFIAPNFAIGAVLMMKMAKAAAKYLPHVEIIEMHHDQKLDAPSGTALRTAQLIKEVRESLPQGHPNEKELIPGARGSEFDGMRIHSVRLPGYVAHQEVIFGGLGQTLSIRHDSISRESFMPGVVFACRKVQSLQGVVVGLEHILD